MRVLLAAVVLAACASSTPPAATATDERLAPDLCPLTAWTATFLDAKGASPRSLRVEPAGDGTSARLVMDVPGEPSRALSIYRRGESTWIAAGDDAGVELLRGGARPGDAWESDGRRVRFEGWETLGAWTAARVASRSGPAQLEQV